MDVNLDALDDIIIKVLMIIRSLPESLDNYSNFKDDLDTLNQLLLLIGEIVFKVWEQRRDLNVQSLLEIINKELNDLLVWMENLPFDQGDKHKRNCLFFWTNPTKNHISSLLVRIKRKVQSLKDIASSACPAAMLTNSSDGSGKLKNDGEGSKHKLTPSQKICLSYCSLFPKNHTFQVGDLINLCMAEGFLVSQCPEEIGEEIGRRYISEFLGMSKFQRMEDECGFLGALKMDPQMYDQATSERFRDSVTVVDESGSCKGKHVVSFHCSLDHACRAGILKSLFAEAKHLKTILLAPRITQSRVPNTMKMDSSTCKEIFCNFKTLRLLDLHDLGIKEVPPTISGLTDLRYLNLSENDMTYLPSSITKLRNLQTLILSGCRKLKELPKKLHALGNLRHLNIEGCQNLTGVPATMGKLTSLVTLSHYIVGKRSSSIQKLTGLNNLRGNLEILHLERLEDTKFRRLLTEKKHLDGLALRWDHTNDNNRVQLHRNDMNSLRLLQPHTNLKVLTVTGYRGEIFPDWLLSLQCLVKFELDNCTTCKSLPPVHRLPSLKILRLKSLDSLECINTSVGNEESAMGKEDGGEASFSGISKLEIQRCSKLTTILPLYPRLDGELVLDRSSLEPLRKTTAVSQPLLSSLKSMLIENIEENFPQELKSFENFTSLEQLVIRECHHFSSLPKGFEHLAALKSLTIEKCRELESLPDEFKFLTSLQCLTIRSCKRLKLVPRSLGELSLKEFQISGCANLTLPEDFKQSRTPYWRDGWCRKVEALRRPVISGVKVVVTTQGSCGRCRT